MLRFNEYETLPYGFAAGDENLYRFVGNDPVNQLDPSGLMSKKEAEAALLEFQKSEYYKSFFAAIEKSKCESKIVLSEKPNINDTKVSGKISGLTSSDGKIITLYYDNIGSVKQFNYTLAHELIHSWDACNKTCGKSSAEVRMAVLELRAYALSGEFGDVKSPGSKIFDQTVAAVEAQRDASINKNELFQFGSIQDYIYILWDKVLSKDTMWLGYAAFSGRYEDLTKKPDTEEYKKYGGAVANLILERAKGIFDMK